MKTLDTGFKLRDIIGGSDDGRIEYHYVYDPDISQKERCNKCIAGARDECIDIDDAPCQEEKFYVINKVSEKEYLKRAAYGIININKLAEGCRDFCIFYRDNCYNKEEKHCILRMLLRDIEYTY